ncbi:hypothetical protein P8452_51239 [Trifolium repens]|nr:hypothetical protein P8452_51239 [Trifolium repens]
MPSHGAPNVLRVHKRKIDKKEKGTRKIPKKAAGQRLDVGWQHACGAVPNEVRQQMFDNVNKLQINLIENRTPSEDVKENEANDKLMTSIRSLEKLEGIGGGPFTKALKILKEDPLWRDVFLALSDDRKKDFVLNL